MPVKLSSPQAFRIAKYLLKNQIVHQRQICRDLKLSLSWVNEVLNSLFEAGIVRKGKMRRIELEDPYALLDLLSWQRPLQRFIEYNVRSEQTNINSIEKELNDVCLKAGIKCALTAFSGLMHYLPYYLTFPMVHTYADDPKKLRTMLLEGRGPITIEVLRPDYRIILENSVKIDELNIVDDVQVVIDLFCLGFAGRDAAVQLYERIRNEQKRTR